MIGALVLIAILKAPFLNGIILGLSLFGIPPSGKMTSDQPFFTSRIALIIDLADFLSFPLYTGMFIRLKKVFINGYFRISLFPRNRNR